MKLKNILNFFKQPHGIFIIVALIAGIAFVKLTPPLWGLDEQSHFARVFHIVRGEFVSDQNKDNKNNLVPDNFFELYVNRTKDILDVVKSDTVIMRNDVTDPSSYVKIGSQKFSKSEHFFPFIANYSPIAYPGPIVGLLIAQAFNANINHTLLFMRFMGLISYIVIAALAVWLVRNYKIKWLFFTVALVPTAIFQASVITADTVLIAAVLLFFALLYRVAQDKKPKRNLLISLATVGVLIPLMKLNYFIIILALAALPVIKFKSLKFSLLYKSAVIALGAIVVIVWAMITHVTATPEISQRGDAMTVSPSDQISFVVHNPIDFMASVVRSLVAHGDAYYQGLLFTVSGNDVNTPLLLTIVFSIAIIIAGLLAKDEILKIKNIVVWSCIAAIVMAATIFGSLYAAFTPVGWPFVDGVQGRYFLPVIIPVVMLFAILIPINIKPIPRSIIYGIISVAIAALLVSIAYVRLALY